MCKLQHPNVEYLVVTQGKSSGWSGCGAALYKNGLLVSEKSQPIQDDSDPSFSAMLLGLSLLQDKGLRRVQFKLATHCLATKKEVTTKLKAFPNVQIIRHQNKRVSALADAAICGFSMHNIYTYSRKRKRCKP